MTVITVVDFLGDTTELIFTAKKWIGATRLTDDQLIETWVYADKDWLPNYPMIPIPIFTDWWE